MVTSHNFPVTVLNIEERAVHILNHISFASPNHNFLASFSRVFLWSFIGD